MAEGEAFLRTQQGSAVIVLRVAVEPDSHQPAVWQIDLDGATLGLSAARLESHWKGNGWGKSYISPEHAKELAISFAAHWKEERG